jgi:hypothetical protein
MPDAAGAVHMAKLSAVAGPVTVTFPVAAALALERMVKPQM